MPVRTITMASLWYVLFSILVILLPPLEGHISTCIDRFNSTMMLDFENNDWMSQDSDFLTSVIENGELCLDRRSTPFAGSFGYRLSTRTQNT